MNKMSRKVSEKDQIKTLYENLKDEIEKSDQKFKRQIRMCKQKMMDYDIQKRDMHALIANEKKMKIHMASQIAYFVSEIVSLKQQKKSSERYIKHLENKIKNLSSSNDLLTEEITERKNSIISITTSISSQHTITSQDMAQNIPNINGEEDNNYRINLVGEKVYTASVADISGPSSIRPSESILLDAGNESSMSNKSVHDDEERCLNHSIVAEIKQDDPNGKDVRLQGSKKSNAIYLPHMRTFRQVKLNRNGSPFHKRLYHYMTQQSEAKDMVNNKQSEVSAVNKGQMNQTSTDEQINEKKAAPCHTCGVPFDTGRFQASLENPVQAAAGSASDLTIIEDEDAIDFEELRSNWMFPKRSRGSQGEVSDSEDSCEWLEKSPSMSPNHSPGSQEEVSDSENTSESFEEVQSTSMFPKRSRGCQADLSYSEDTSESFEEVKSTSMFTKRSRGCQTELSDSEDTSD